MNMYIYTLVHTQPLECVKHLTIKTSEMMRIVSMILRELSQAVEMGGVQGNQAPVSPL